ncbi:TrmH family RNA methyltransferase [Streptomyces sp. NPDC094448]|uniref:TrmH family RNA methyltransferase n=1 Tax=Streptomyces sp. NPDC094448 TaxID=3366063 RepID=UPI00381B30CD
MTLDRDRELLIVCAPLRTRANLSSIVRTAGCSGIKKIVACGNGRVDERVARDGAHHVDIEVRRTLTSVLKKLRQDGYRLVALEQTSNSQNLHHYAFPRKTALVVGNERTGITDEELQWVDDCVEIPVWGMPHSYNVATATGMAIYEYCRQYPQG